MLIYNEKREQFSTVKINEIMLDFCENSKYNAYIN
jgi:hypothetical protein